MLPLTARPPDLHRKGAAAGQGALSIVFWSFRLIAVGQNEGHHFIDAVLALGIDTGVVDVGVAEPLVEHHFRLHSGPVQLHAVAQGLLPSAKQKWALLQSVRFPAFRPCRAFSYILRWKTSKKIEKNVDFYQ